MRYWQLANARYVLGVTGFLDALNTQNEKYKGQWRIVSTFDVAPKSEAMAVNKLEDLTVTPMPNGPLALFEFTGALPRARLFPQWQVITNGPATLARLGDPAFDPAQSVLVMDEIPAPAATNAAPGTVEFIRYAPRHIDLRTEAATLSVLLLADRFDAGWNVFVDDKPQKLLRCNFITRGVQVPAGSHTVSFRFEPPTKLFWISLGAACFGLLLCGFLALAGRNGKPAHAHARQK